MRLRSKYKCTIDDDGREIEKGTEEMRLNWMHKFYFVIKFSSFDKFNLCFMMKNK